MGTVAQYRKFNYFLDKMSDAIEESNPDWGAIFDEIVEAFNNFELTKGDYGRLVVTLEDCGFIAG